MDKNKFSGFKYNYSAKEQAELKKIRAKYTSEKFASETNILEKVKKLDKRVTDKATAIALCIGIISLLIMGFGMSLIMTDIGLFSTMANNMFLGIVIGLLGMIGVISAYPIYQKILIHEQKKAAPEILKLTDKFEIQ